MAIDIRMQHFAYDMFYVMLSEYNFTRKFIEVGSYNLFRRVSDFDESMYKAIKCRQYLFRNNYRKLLDDNYTMFRDTLSDYNSFIRCLFSQKDFAGLTVFDHIFATAAFMIETVLYACFEHNFGFFISRIHLCWAMYFDSVKIEDFYKNGGWSTFKMTARSYIRPYQFLMIYFDKEKLVSYGHVELTILNFILINISLFKTWRYEDNEQRKNEGLPKDETTLARYWLDFQNGLTKKFLSILYLQNRVLVTQPPEILFHDLKNFCDPLADEIWQNTLFSLSNFLHTTSQKLFSKDLPEYLSKKVRASNDVPECLQEDYSTSNYVYRIPKVWKEHDSVELALTNPAYVKYFTGRDFPLNDKTLSLESASQAWTSGGEPKYQSLPKAISANMFEEFMKANFGVSAMTDSYATFIETELSKLRDLDTTLCQNKSSPDVTSQCNFESFIRKEVSKICDSDEDESTSSTSTHGGTETDQKLQSPFKINFLQREKDFQNNNFEIKEYVVNKDLKYIWESSQKEFEQASVDQNSLPTHSDLQANTLKSVKNGSDVSLAKTEKLMSGENHLQNKELPLGTLCSIKSSLCSNQGVPSACKDSTEKQSSENCRISDTPSENSKNAILNQAVSSSNKHLDITDELSLETPCNENLTGSTKFLSKSSHQQASITKNRKKKKKCINTETNEETQDVTSIVHRMILILGDPIGVKYIKSTVKIPVDNLSTSQ